MWSGVFRSANVHECVIDHMCILPHTCMGWPIPVQDSLADMGAQYTERRFCSGNWIVACLSQVEP